MPGPLLTAALPSLISAGGDIIGGLIGSKGQASANAANLQIARENREWQAKMSNTAYQRAAKDLEAAGLNRILALGSPATTPGGNVATMQNEKAPLAQGIGKGVTSALMAATLKGQIKKLDAEADNTIADTELKRSQLPINTQQLENLRQQYNLTTEQIQQVQASADLARANAAQSREMAKQIIEQAKSIKTATERARWELELEQSLYSGKLGHTLYLIKQMAAPLAALIGGVAVGSRMRQKTTKQETKTTKDFRRKSPLKDRKTDSWWNPNIPETN